MGKSTEVYTADSGRPLNANSCRVSFNSCTMTFLRQIFDVSKAWLQRLFLKFERCNYNVQILKVNVEATP
jgi:hypothetical protein